MTKRGTAFDLRDHFSVRLRSTGTRKVLRTVFALLLVCLIVPGRAGFAQPAIPDALEPWRDWVLFGQEYRACPVLNGRDANQQASYVCAWPGELDIEVDASGARFEQNWTLYREDWVPLPGDGRYWPGRVTVDGEQQAAVLRGNRPTVRVAAGQHRIAGELGWETRPASIPVPAETGLVALTLDGASVPIPELDGGVLWLGLRADLVVEEDRLNVAVYRLLTDSIPIRLETRIQLDVAGQSRELELSGAQLPDFVGESLSSDLPAELDADGTFRMQVRPGRFNATLIAHRPDMAGDFMRPDPVAPWPNDEVWSFRSNPSLRVSVLEGAPPVDSQRAGVPTEWQSLPSYAVASDTMLDLVERSRNDAAGDNDLQLSRYLWLDFDGEGLTAQDRVTGQMRSGWRLDMAPPYTMTMASIGNDNLLVTQGETPGAQGVELRAPDLDLTATARLPWQTMLPVTGYTQDFDSASTTLNLPPAHRLLAAPGSDSASGAWIERWRLLDIFLALIIAVASWRLLGVTGGLVALATLVLIYHEPWAPHYAWLNVLLITALLRLVPAGRFRSWCARYRWASLAALGLLLIPFVATELRVVVYPQLERTFLARGVPSPSASGFARNAASAALRSPTVAGNAQVEALQESRIRRQDFNAPSALPVSPEEAAPEPGVTASAATRAQLPTEAAGAIGLQTARYQPGALVQTGPGLPDWAWTRYTLQFSGPITPDQTFSLVIAGPWLVALWRVANVVLVLAFASFLLRPEIRLPRLRRGSGAAATAVLLALGASLPGPSHAQTPDGFPPVQLLDELRQRLTTPAPCHPDCAELTDATVTVGDTALTLELEMALQDSVAVPIPGSLEGFRPETLTVDGSSRRMLLRDAAGQAWLRLEAGVRNVILTGPLPAGDSLRLPFPLTPRRIDVEAPGWDISGISEGRLPSGALELVRRREPQAGEEAQIQTTAFPPYVQVIRTIGFGIDWTVATTVRRVAPSDSAFTIQIGLLPDEAVVTQDIEVENGTATASFAAGQRAVSWQSRLPTADTISLTAGNDVPWSEIWRFSLGYEWHAEYDGLPATRVLPAGTLALITEYLPRPGETLDVSLTRPEPASGDTIAIDSVDYARSVGARASSSTVTFDYRSTRAVEHPIRLPEGSELGDVTIDGQTVPLELDANTVSLPVTPGAHRVSLNWRNAEGIGVRAAVAPIDLGTGASNITTRLNLPGDRWTLLTFGPTLGPAVLYWAELAVFVLAAVILGKLALSPLRTYEWLLLGLGLSTFSWPVLLLFAAWAFLMSWRGRRKPEGPRYLVNTIQVALAVLTLVTVITLVGSIANGLLGSPRMHIVSPVAGGLLSWFLDRSDGPTPASSAISVSLWFYKAAMLGWALWLSFAVLKWLRWAWTAFSFDGAWHGKVAVE